MKLSCVCAVFLFIISGCSFSKDQTRSENLGKTTAKVITYDKADAEPSAAEVTYKQIHVIEREMAEASVLGKSIQSDLPNNYTEYAKAIDEIYSKAQSGALNDASIAFVKSNLQCEDIQVSLMLKFIRANGSNFSPIIDVLKKVSCSKVSSESLHSIYLLEMRRQFLRQFDDLSLLKFVLKNDHFDGVTMVPLGESGVSVSPVVLRRIWIACEYNKNPEQSDEFLWCEHLDFSDEAKKKKDNDFATELGLDPYGEELKIIVDGKLIARTSAFQVVRYFEHSFADLVVHYMKGEAIPAKDFQEAALRTMTQENLQ
ncbi:MAG TPA: hypothetical protein VF412_12370 [Bdellovibrio sp.]|uniref:hypothetical protein n=1 Tax=Bdellovibrio sp. TaxID=28201 RepID=UPI002EE7E814